MTQKERLQAMVRRRLAALQQLERERNAVLRAVSQYVSGQRAQHERRVIEKIPYTPLKYE